MTEEKSDSFYRRLIWTEVSLAVLVLGLALLWHLRHLGLELLVAVVLAVVAEPGVKLLTRLPIRRSMAVVMVFLLIVTIVLVALFVIAVPLVNAGVRLADNLPSLVASLRSDKGRFAHMVYALHLQKYLHTSTEKVAQLLSQAAQPAYSAAKGVFTTLASITTVFVLAIFLSLEAPSMLRGVMQILSHNHASKLREILQETARSVTGYVLGNFATSAIAGVVVAISLALLGVPYIAVLGVWVGLVDLLPLVGGLLAGIPTVLIAFLHSGVAGIVMLVVFLAYQQLENHVLSPYIMSKTVKMNPFWILLAVLVGAELAGILGALMGIPVASALQVIAKALWDSRVQKPSDSMISNMPETSLPTSE